MNRSLLAALLLASSQAPLGSTLVAVAIPSIAGDLQADIAQVTTVIVGSYLIITVLLQGPGGWLTDVIGHSRTLWIGIALFAAGAVLGLASADLTLLGVARSVIAAGGALIIPATMALMRVHVSPERRGRVFGTFGAAMALSAAIGPAMGGVIVGMFGWRAIFVASLPFLAAASLLLRLQPTLQEPTPTYRSEKTFRTFDLPGVVVLGLALGLLVGGTQVLGEMRIALLLSGLCLGAGFVVRQWWSDDPVLAVRLLTKPVMAGATAIMALQNFAMYGLLFQLPAFFEHVRGSPPRVIGFALFAMMLGMVVASPLGGRASDRLGARLAGLIGASVLLVGSLMLTRMQSFDTPLDAIPSLIVFGLGMGLSSAPAQSSAMSGAPQSEAGRAAGLSSTMRYVGGIATIGVQAIVLGSDSTVTLAHHQIMVALYVVAVALSLAAACLLPRGIGEHTTGKS